MAKITIKEEEVNRFKENPEALQEIFMYAIGAEDIEAIKLLCELTAIKSHIDKQKIFDELICVVGDDKKYELVKSIIEGLQVDLSQQTDERIGTQAAQKITLLEAAACYGSVKIGKFLLDQGFNPNHQDANQQTPLHYAVMYNQQAFITLLHNREADLNIKDDQGYTALHLTILYKRYTIREQLKKLGANPNIKDNHGYNHQKLHEHIIKTKQEKSPPELLPIAPLEHCNLYKGIVSFFKATLLDENREQYILTAINSLKKFLDPLTKPPANAASAQELPVSSAYIEKALSTLATVYECYKDNNSTELQGYIIDKAKYWGAFTVLAMLYNAIAVEYLDISDYNNAKKYVESANTSYNRIETQDKSLQELQHNILFNLGKVWRYFDTEKFVQYFIQAEKLMPNNQDTVLELLKCYIMYQDDSKFSEQLAKITDQDLKTLYSILQKLEVQNLGFQSDLNIATTLQLQASRTEDKELRKLYNIMSEFSSPLGSTTISELCTKHDFTFLKHGDPEAPKYTLYIEIWAKHFLQQKEFTKAINCWLELNTHRDQHNIPIHLLNILEICKKAGYWERGLESLNDIYAKYPNLSNHTMLPLKYLEFIFYEANGYQQQSKDCWDFLKDHAKLGDTAFMLFSYAKNFALYTAIEKGNFDKAFNYLSLPPPAWDSDIEQATLQLFPWHFQRLLYDTIISKKLVFLLKKLQDSLPIEPTPSVATAEASFADEVVAIDLTEDTDDLSELIDTLDPKAIHAYFQQKKMELLKKPIEAPIKEPPCVWNTPTGIYSSKQKGVYHVEGREKFYATINPKLFDNLTSELLDQFTNALSKGLINQDRKNNGIKIIPKQLIELKITGDDRLYTDHIYKNSQGKYLIDFDKHGGHENVKKAIQKSSWKIVECGDERPCIPNIPTEVKETDTSYSPQHITKEMEHVSVSEEEWVVKLSGNYDVE